MTLKLGVVMDPIESIKPKKDTTLAMMLAAQQKGWELFYMGPNDLYLREQKCRARVQPVVVRDDVDDWYSLGEPADIVLADLDVVLMRKDPPFDIDYIYTTYFLEQAEKDGCLVVNRPSSLRDANEKLFTAWFPQCCPVTLVSSNMTLLREFVAEHKDAIVKPLDGMGGSSIFRLKEDDPNIGVVLETMTNHGRRFIMAQKFLPEIVDGDKRILMVNGKPIPYGLSRIPAKGETRGNLAAGGRGEARPLTERELWICDQVGDELVRRGLYFVGLDVIGDYLTEINVTSPTCIREIDQAYGLNIALQLMDEIEQLVDQQRAG